MSSTQIHAFHCGGENMPRSGLGVMASDPGGIVYAPYFLYLIEHPRGSILFDTGVNPEMARDIVAYMGPAGEGVDLRMTEEDAVIGRLALIGKDPGQITHIVESHLHYDHAGGLEFFPGLPVYVQQDELEYAFDPPVYQADTYIEKDFGGDVDWQPVKGEFDLFGDGSVVMIPTPGHTKGHQSLLVQLDSHPVLLCADAANTPWVMEENLLPGLVESPPDVIRTYELLRQIRDERGAELILAHDLEFETKTKIAPGGFYE